LEDLSWRERRVRWRLGEIARMEEAKGRTVWVRGGRIRIWDHPSDGRHLVVVEGLKWSRSSGAVWLVTDCHSGLGGRGPTKSVHCTSSPRKRREGGLRSLRALWPDAHRGRRP